MVIHMVRLIEILPLQLLLGWLFSVMDSIILAMASQLELLLQPHIQVVSVQLLQFFAMSFLMRLVGSVNYMNYRIKLSSGTMVIADF